MSPDELRERYERIKAEAGPSVTVVVATKYVNVDELQALADAGIEVVGENRAQDLEAKHARYGDRFRWHFIGHLQSRKAKVVNDLCELCHSLASESAAKPARRFRPSSRSTSRASPRSRESLPRSSRASSSCTATCAA